MAIIRGDPPDPDKKKIPIVLPKYCDLWNGDTSAPAGKLFFSPIGRSVNPATIGAGQSPFDVEPKNSREGKPEYDGVWFYDCSAISLPRLEISDSDINMSTGTLTTRTGTLGHTLKGIIKLIKKLNQIRPPCTEQAVNDGVETLRKLIKELSRVGITLKTAEPTPEFIRTNFCGTWPSAYNVILGELMQAMMELFQPPHTLPHFPTVQRPWTGPPGDLGNCRWVFLGYYKRGKAPSGGGTPITPPSNPDPAAPNIIVSVVPRSTTNPKSYYGPGVVGTADSSPPNKKYKLKNTKGLIKLPSGSDLFLGWSGLVAVRPALTKWPE